MARQAPEFVPVSAGQSNRPLGIYGSYYKLFRCSDGKLRLNLISEEEYLESKKRPISVDDVSSTTDVVPISCPHGHHHGHHPTAIQPVIMQQPAPGKRLHCVPEQSSQQPRIKRQRTAGPLPEAAHQSSLKRQKQDRTVRSTVAVADLIAEYIPVGVPVVSSSPVVTDSNSTGPVQPDSSSNGSGDTAGLHQEIPTALSGTPATWNSWIQTVGRRFPMADMSVRQVLDTLDRRPEVSAAND